ncbi:MAG: MnhB domain-containing protein [Acidimicrobiia bacterium]|nr:MnhB domain-containing protein [Acidimicrobiia bacterium]
MIASRSPIAQASVRVVVPPTLVVAAFVFFAGHNRPGGGFAAGLVLGAVLALRAMAAMPVRVPATGALAAGAATVSAVAMLPLLGGGRLLDQAIGAVDLPVLGTVKFGTALVFDAGVVLVVVGLVAAVLEGLGALVDDEETP